MVTIQLHPYYKARTVRLTPVMFPADPLTRERSKKRSEPAAILYPVTPFGHQGVSCDCIKVLQPLMSFFKCHRRIRNCFNREKTQAGLFNESLNPESLEDSSVMHCGIILWPSDEVFFVIFVGKGISIHCFWGDTKFTDTASIYIKYIYVWYKFCWKKSKFLFLISNTFLRGQ